MNIKILEKKYEELKMDTLTGKYTIVMAESEFHHNAPHNFLVVRSEDAKVIEHIHFQEGPVKEAGVNGAMNEDLLNMVLCRLKHFQESEFACEENLRAAECIESALSWLRIRTDKREKRGVEGTHEV